MKEFENEKKQREMNKLRSMKNLCFETQLFLALILRGGCCLSFFMFDELAPLFLAELPEYGGLNFTHSL